MQGRCPPSPITRSIKTFLIYNHAHCVFCSSSRQAASATTRGTGSSATTRGSCAYGAPPWSGSASGEAAQRRRTTFEPPSSSVVGSSIDAGTVKCADHADKDTVTAAAAPTYASSRSNRGFAACSDVDSSAARSASTTSFEAVSCTTGGSAAARTKLAGPACRSSTSSGSTVVPAADDVIGHGRSAGSSAATAATGRTATKASYSTATGTRASPGCASICSSAHSKWC